MTDPVTSFDVTVDRVGPGGGVASDSAFGVALVTLWQRCAEAGEPVGFAPPVVRADIAVRAAALVDEIKAGRLIAVAANRKRRLVGAALVRPGRNVAGHTGHLEIVLVDPEHRAQGIGRLLLDRALDLTRAAGVDRIDVDVPAVPDLQAFFAAFGFAEWGRRSGWLSKPDRDELLMGKML